MKDSHTLLVASFAGPATAVKAVAAILQGDTGCEFSVDDCSPVWRANKYKKGYRVHRTRLALDLWHYVAVVKADNFMLSVSDEALWQVLKSAKYTTPLLRRWVPWLRAELTQLGHIRQANCWQCSVAGLALSTQQLDEIVSDGIKQGFISIGE